MATLANDAYSRSTISSGDGQSQVRPPAAIGGGGRYGDVPGIGWKALAVIAALHAVLLAALCLLDVVHVGPRPARRLIVMPITPLPVAPPPAPVAAPRETPPPKPPIEAPTPIVRVAAPAPSPIIVAPIAPPAPPAPPAPSAPPAAPTAIAETAPPITAPDGSAKSLGNPSPRYPVEARQRHQEGTVRLRVVITVEGRVRDITVARSSGVDALDDAALATVRRWRFLPGKQAGVPVEAVGFLNIPFRLT